MDWSDDEDKGGGFGFGNGDNSDDFDSSWDAVELPGTEAPEPEPQPADEDGFVLEGASGFLPPIKVASAAAEEPPAPRVPSLGGRSSPMSLPGLGAAHLGGASPLAAAAASPPMGGLVAVSLAQLSPVRLAPEVDAGQAQKAAQAQEAERKRAADEDAAFRLALADEAAKRKAAADAEAAEKAKQEELVRQAAARLEAERQEAARQERANEEAERQRKIQQGLEDQRRRAEEARQQEVQRAEEARTLAAAEAQRKQDEAAAAARADAAKPLPLATAGSDGYGDDDFEDDGYGSEDFEDVAEVEPKPAPAPAPEPAAEPEPEPEPAATSTSPSRPTGGGCSPPVPPPAAASGWSPPAALPECKSLATLEPQPEPQPAIRSAFGSATGAGPGGFGGFGGGANSGFSPKGFSSQLPPSISTGRTSGSLLPPAPIGQSRPSGTTLDRLEFEASVAEGAAQAADEMGRQLNNKVEQAKKDAYNADANAAEKARVQEQQQAGSAAKEAEPAEYSDEDFEDYEDEGDFEDSGSASTEEDEEASAPALAPAPWDHVSAALGRQERAVTPTKSLLDSLDAAASPIRVPTPEPEPSPVPRHQAKPPELPASKLSPKPLAPYRKVVAAQSAGPFGLKAQPPQSQAHPVDPNGAFGKAVHTEKDVNAWRRKKNKEAKKKAKEAARVIREAEEKEAAAKAVAKADLEAGIARRKKREAKKEAKVRAMKDRKKAAKAAREAKMVAAVAEQARLEKEERMEEEEKKRQVRERGRGVIEEQRMKRKEAAEMKRRLRLERRLAAMEREDAVALVSERAEEKLKLNVLAGRVAELETEIQKEEEEIQQLKLPAIDQEPQQVQTARTPRTKSPAADSRGWVTNRTPSANFDPAKAKANDMARSRRVAMKQDDGKRRKVNMKALRKIREAQKERAEKMRRASTKMQAVWRGFAERMHRARDAAAAAERNNAATGLQATWRGTSTRKQIKRDRAAAEIAAADAVLGLVLRNWFPIRQLWRRRRQKVENHARLELIKSQVLSTSKIQAFYRGHLARREIVWLSTQVPPVVSPPMVLAPAPPATGRRPNQGGGRRTQQTMQAVVEPQATPGRRALWL